MVKNDKTKVNLLNRKALKHGWIFYSYYHVIDKCKLRWFFIPNFSGSNLIKIS